MKDTCTGTRRMFYRTLTLRWKVRSYIEVGWRRGNGKREGSRDPRKKDFPLERAGNPLCDGCSTVPGCSDGKSLISVTVMPFLNTPLWQMLYREKRKTIHILFFRRKPAFPNKRTQLYEDRKIDRKCEKESRARERVRKRERERETFLRS